jgi:hypothetical protein
MSEQLSAASQENEQPPPPVEKQVRRDNKVPGLSDFPELLWPSTSISPLPHGPLVLSPIQTSLINIYPRQAYITVSAEDHPVVHRNPSCRSALHLPSAKGIRSAVHRAAHLESELASFGHWTWRFRRPRVL